MSSRCPTDRARRVARHVGRAIAPAMALVAAAACAGGEPEQLLPPAGMTQQGAPVHTSVLRAGAPATDVAAENPYAADGAALAEGRRLYSAMNCVGCHGGAGGGGMGPPFADAEWIYGSDPENIVQSILQGRPNGMPAFGGKLPPDAAWRLAAYVRGLDPHVDEKPATTAGETITGDGDALARQQGSGRNAGSGR